jgi:hypothetical protein
VDDEQEEEAEDQQFVSPASPMDVDTCMENRDDFHLMDVYVVIDLLSSIE